MRSKTVEVWQSHTAARIREQKDAADRKAFFVLSRKILNLISRTVRGYKVTEYMTHIVLTHPKREQIILSHQAAYQLIQRRPKDE